ncbi:MAG TPA: PIN domain-containing protein [Abditibacteriaceae bacterium]|jgi:predicted nucleic acid-binding protein
MSLFEDVMSLAVQLPMTERERLARALGLNAHTRGTGKTLSLNAFVAQPSPQDSAAWRARETGHAVVDTRKNFDESIVGPDAIFGLGGASEIALDETLPLASSLPHGAPVVVTPAIVLALLAGDERARGFWTNGAVEPRLATASFLALLDEAASDDDARRMQSFVQPFAVLSLGPMASSRAVELMARRGDAPLSSLDALAAATALAHEIPLVALQAAPFANIAELAVVRPF